MFSEIFPQKLLKQHIFFFYFKSIKQSPLVNITIIYLIKFLSMFKLEIISLKPYYENGL